MTVSLIAPPVLEPVSLDEVKAHLRLTGSDDDDYLAAMIAAARIHVESATRRLLIEAGYDYHMDDYSGDIPFLDTATVPGKPIAIVPYQLDTNDMKMWTDPAYTPRDWLQYAIDSFDRIYAEGLAGNPRMMSLGLHLRIIGRPGRIGALAAFLDHVARHDRVWVTTRHSIAKVVLPQS